MYRWGFSSGKNVVQTEKMLKDFFLKNFGTNFIQIICMVVNIAKPEVGIYQKTTLQKK